MLRLSQIIFGMILLGYLATFVRADFILIDYYSNKAQITAEHCVNKDKPELHCQGKCYLKKKLENSIQLEKQEISNTTEFPSNYCFLSFPYFIFNEIKLLTLTQQNKEHNFNYGFLTLDSNGDSVFNPPETILFIS